jgi:hypothetical protein
MDEFGGRRSTADPEFIGGAGRVRNRNHTLRALVVIFTPMLLLTAALPPLAMGKESSPSPAPAVDEAASVDRFIAYDPNRPQLLRFALGPGGHQSHGKRTVGSEARRARFLRIRDFVLYSYSHVIEDMINGHGPYFDTLCFLAGIEKRQKMAFRSVILRIFHENKRIPDFSNLVAEHINTR